MLSYYILLVSTFNFIVEIKGQQKEKEKFRLPIETYYSL